MKWTTVILILICLIIFSIIIILIFTKIDNDVSNKDIPPQILGSFMQSCYSKSCNEPYVCDENTLTCRIPEKNVPCRFSSDCQNGLFCSGLCVSGPIGTANKYCPCEEKYICESQGINQVKLCKGIEGAPCITDNDCSELFICNSNNVCTNNGSRQINSLPCVQNIDCESRNCSLGYCQPANMISGTMGSSCTGECLGLPDYSRCNGSFNQNPLTCHCNGPNTSGTCVSDNNPLLTNCNKTGVLCNEPFSCLTNDLSKPCDTDNISNCLCSFNPIPNTPPCIEGMIQNLNTCYNIIPCSVDSQCVNGCNKQNKSKISYYKFTNSDGEINNIVPNNNMKCELMTFDGPETSNIKEIVSCTIDNVDRLYVLADEGIYYAVNTNFTNIKWNLIIDQVGIVDISWSYELNSLFYMLFDGTDYIMCRWTNSTSIIWPDNTDGIPVNEDGTKCKNITKFQVSASPGVYVAIVSDGLLRTNDTETTTTFLYPPNTDDTPTLKLNVNDISYIYFESLFKSTILYTQNAKSSIIKTVIGPQFNLPKNFYVKKISNSKNIASENSMIVLVSDDTSDKGYIYINPDMSNFKELPIPYNASVQNTKITSSLKSYYIIDKHSCN
jgi:hypothetical protein